MHVFSLIRALALLYSSCYFVFQVQSPFADVNLLSGPHIFMLLVNTCQGSSLFFKKDRISSSLYLGCSISVSVHNLCRLGSIPCLDIIFPEKGILMYLNESYLS